MSDVLYRINNNGSFVLNITPESFLRQPKEIKDMLLQTANFFIDEYDYMTQAQSYRTSFPDFLKVFFNNTKLPWIISTATPAYNLLDIPKKHIDTTKIIISISNQIEIVIP